MPAGGSFEGRVEGMFERFTADARSVVTKAQAEARALRSERVGTEHLLLGLLSTGGSARVLEGFGVSATRVGEAVAREAGPVVAGAPLSDAEALEVIGIDLDEVRERVEETFGPGALERPAGRQTRGSRPWVSRHIPFTPGAKKVLELSLREALRLGHRSIGTEHILLGLVREGGGLGATILEQEGVRQEAVRRAVSAELDRTADPPSASA